MQHYFRNYIQLPIQRIRNVYKKFIHGWGNVLRLFYFKKRKSMSELTQIQHDVNSLRQDFNNHRILTGSKVDEINVKMDRLLTLLEGDPIDPSRGFFSRLKAMEEFIEGLKSTKSYIRGNIAAAVFVISAIGGVIAFFWKLFEYMKK